MLVVAADAGFADATSDEFAKTGKLVLQPWGRIEGEVRIGRKPAAYQSVVYLPELPSNRGDAFRMRSYDYHFTADSQGRFAIDRVIPGRGHIARVLDTTYRNEWCGQVPVEVKPGQTTQVRLGGKGRPVIGRVVLDGTPPEPVDWRSNDASRSRTAQSRAPQSHDALAHVRVGVRRRRQVPHRGRGTGYLRVKDPREFAFRQEDLGPPTRHDG